MHRMREQADCACNFIRGRRTIRRQWLNLSSASVILCIAHHLAYLSFLALHLGNIGMLLLAAKIFGAGRDQWLIISIAGVTGHIAALCPVGIDENTPAQ